MGEAVDEKTLDIARTVMICCLPSPLQEEPLEAFPETIYEMFEDTFAVPRDAIDHVLRFPRLDPDAKEFGCKCLISFRSRVHKHRIIAQKSKLSAPTTVEAISEIPKDFYEPEEELEMADECGDEDEPQMEDESDHKHNDMKAQVNGAPLKTADANAEAKAVCEDGRHSAASAERCSIDADLAVSAEAVHSSAKEPSTGGAERAAEKAAYVSAAESAHAATDADATANGTKADEFNDDVVLIDDEKMDTPDLNETDNKEETRVGGLEHVNGGKKKCGEEGDGDVSADLENKVELEDDDGDAVGKEAAGEKEVSGSDSNKKKSEADNSDAATKSGSDKKQDAGNAKAQNECKFDAHVEPYTSLPLSWDGAPEFQWKTVTDPADRRIMVIENAMPSDMLNPWLYPAILRAHQVDTSFSRAPGQEGKELTGRIELQFVDDVVISSCAINYLVHVRTPRGRRVRIFIPQTKQTMRLKEDLEKRLGRLRKPTDCMAQLIVKSLTEEVTEEAIREFYSDFEIKDIQFKNDLLKHICAIVTFSSTEQAIAAHSANEFVQFNDVKLPKGCGKVLYAYASIREWGKGHDAMLTRAEWKQYREEERVKAAAEKAKESVQEEGTDGKPKAAQKRSQQGGDGDGVAPKKTRGRILKRGTNTVPRGGSASARGGMAGRGAWSGRGARGIGGSFPSRSSRGAPSFRGSFVDSRKGTSRGYSSAISGAHSGRSNAGLEMVKPSRAMFRSQQNSFYAADSRSLLTGHRGGRQGFGGGMSHSGDYVHSSDRSLLDVAGYDSRRAESYPRQQSQPSRTHLIDPDIFMEERIREQRKQLELQEHLLRQQQIIDDLAVQLRSRGTSSTSASFGATASYSDSSTAARNRSPAYSSPSGVARDSWASKLSYSGDYEKDRDQNPSSYGSAWR